MMEKEIEIEVKKPFVWLLIGFLAILFVLELQVTMSTPINFGDEGYHTRLAQFIAQDVEYYVWRPFERTTLKTAGYFGPPLWNILEASFLFIFGFSEVIIKFLTPFVAFMTGLAVFLLAKRMFNERIAFIASVLTVSIPSFVTYSVLFYTDILLTFYISLFFFTFILALKENRKKYWVLSGVFGALSVLTKTPGLIVFPFIFLAFIYQLIKERKIYILFKKYLLLLVIMALIVSGWLIRNFYYFKNPTCFPVPGVQIFDTKGCSINNFQEKYSFSGRTEQTGTEQNVYSIGITSYLDFAYGALWFVALAFSGGILMLFIKRDLINDLIIILLILLLLVFNYTTGRAEDTARYTLSWVPIIGLVSAMWLEESYEFIKKNWTLIGTLFLLSVNILVLLFYFPLTTTIKSIIGGIIILSTFYLILTKKYQAALTVTFVFIILTSFTNFYTKTATMQQVKQFSPLFFEACNWIEKNTPQNSTLMTIWAHRAVYNCQRNCIGNMADISLSKDLNYTLSVTKQNGITHLFIQKFSLSNEPLEEKYTIDFVQFLENNPDHFENIYENGPPLQQCIQQGGCDGNILYKIVG
jgi:4-amino-4-deoxy-L-arabinose transferase-like glycosyltransferase